LFPGRLLGRGGCRVAPAGRGVAGAGLGGGQIAIEALGFPSVDKGIERRQEENHAQKENHEISVREQEMAEGSQEILETAHAQLPHRTWRPWKRGQWRWLAAGTLIER
jgi:hypothetical protein